MRNKTIMSNARIKIVLKYILALVFPPALCVLMIPLFTALLFRIGLLDIFYPKYVPLVFTLGGVIACAISGFIMSLLISSLSRNREIMMTLFGVLIVAIIYIIIGVDFFGSMDFNIIAAEVFWKHLLMQMALRGIFLLGFALLGAWLIVRKRRHLKVPKES